MPVSGERLLETTKPRHKGGVSICAPGGIRTPNLLIRSQMLYPLSHGRLVPCTWLNTTALDPAMQIRVTQPLEVRLASVFPQRQDTVRAQLQHLHSRHHWPHHAQSPASPK